MTKSSGPATLPAWRRAVPASVTAPPRAVLKPGAFHGKFRAVRTNDYAWSEPELLEVCRKMLRVHGLTRFIQDVQNVRRYYARDPLITRQMNDESAQEVEAAAASVGLKVKPRESDYRDMDHYCTAFLMTGAEQDVSAAHSGDSALVAAARLDSRLVRAIVVGGIYTPAYTVLKKLMQDANIPWAYFNSANTSAPHAREVATGIIGAADAVAATGGPNALIEVKPLGAQPAPEFRLQGQRLKNF